MSSKIKFIRGQTNTNPAPKSEEKDSPLDVRTIQRDSSANPEFLLPTGTGGGANAADGTAGKSSSSRFVTGNSP